MKSSLRKKVVMGINLFNIDRSNAIKPQVFSSRLQLPWGPVTRRRLKRTALIYSTVFLMALLTQQFSTLPQLKAIATGFMLPGTGFLYWASPLGDSSLIFVGLFLFVSLCQLIGIVLWFATGNIIAPALVWISSAIAAGFVASYLPAQVMPLPWQAVVDLMQLMIPLMALLIFLFKVERALKEKQQYQRFCERSPLPVREDRVAENVTSQYDTPVQADRLPVATRVMAVQSDRVGSELSCDNLQKMRALLDRSLQPVETFEGFDWLDQFQTASLRYQINFVSYALSVASQVHLPAAQAYMHTAQSNLARKLLDSRVWGYWQLENIWGNFSTDPNPVTRDNIMLSGFLAAQFGLARNLVCLHDYDSADSLVFKAGRGKEFRYSLAQINEQLAGHYSRAPYGLLACEPNWLFPLCNAITATGMRSLDTQLGTTFWDEAAGGFKHALDTEFTSASGLLVPFRSSRTGVAAPMIGGGAMQSLPCLFLNTLLPETAARQWQLSRHNLTKVNGRRAMWPVDIGNYRLNRAASYGACAAAAVEMGDQDVAQRILDYLEADYPVQVSDGVAHRPKVSLWAHALEFMARAGGHNALRTATTVKRKEGPVITRARYPDVLLASASHHDGCLHAVLYPGNGAGVKSLQIGDLVPHRRYRVVAVKEIDVIADSNGELSLTLMLTARTELTIMPRG